METVNGLRNDMKTGKSSFNCVRCGQDKKLKLLSCLHSLCQVCLEQYEQDTVVCPRCEHITQIPRGPASLRDNVVICGDRLTGTDTQCTHCLLWLSYLPPIEEEDHTTTIKQVDQDQNTTNNTPQQTDLNNTTRNAKDWNVDSGIDNIKVHVSDRSCGNDNYNIQDKKIICDENLKNTINDHLIDLTCDVPSIDDESLTTPEVVNVGCCYCVTCDCVVCDICHERYHEKHERLDVGTAGTDKRKYLNRLLTDVQQQLAECTTKLVQVDNGQSHLVASANSLQDEIKERCDKLCELITARRDTLLREIHTLQRNQQKRYEKQQNILEAQHVKLKDSCKFASSLLQNGSDLDLLKLSQDVSSRLHHLVQEQKQAKKTVEIINLRLGVPDFGDDLHIEKAFGSVVQGVVRCGDAELVRSFQIDLTWPTGLAVTHDHEFVITGKMGAFDKKGKVLFYGKNGQLKTIYDLEENHIPYDTIVISNGAILVTDNTGQILQFDSQGHLASVFKDKFKGTGRMALDSKGNILVTSSEEKLVHMYDESGTKVTSYPDITDGYHDIEHVKHLESHDKCSDSDSLLSHPHFVATNQHDDVVVSDFERNCTVVFNKVGDVKFQYSGIDVEGGQLRCPSAVCCDVFDNILIADFMNDRIHLVSSRGQFLGYLLDKANGVSCPNFISVDNDGHLFVGQYGGEINVFQYLSYVKFV